MIVRYERWGAWVKLESRARPSSRSTATACARWGSTAGAAWATAPPCTAPIEVHMAVTARCGAGCEGCYLDARPDGVEPPRDVLLAELDALRDAGVFTVAFGGGEPTTRDDLDVLAAAARERGITPVLTTSGLGLSDARLETLRGFAQVNVSYDGVGRDYARVRGFDGAAAAERGDRAPRARRDPRRGQRGAHARELPAPARDARASPLARGRRGPAPPLQARRPRRVARLPRAPPDARAGPRPSDHAARPRREHAPMPGDFHVRIDCALVPFLSADEELAAEPARLARFGVFGCEAAAPSRRSPSTAASRRAASREATDLPATDARPGTRPIPSSRDGAPTRGAPAEPCASCSLRTVCKGGCKVVATRLLGAHGPDPECPRVVSHRRAEGERAV